MSKEESRAILDYIALRKVGKIETVLCEYGRYYRVGSEVDMWGTRVSITVLEFQELVKEAMKKEPSREYGEREETRKKVC